ncbi:peptidoglycan DD-metalloendopeptidase family protein [Catenovulum agarivorans]|uniref:peptidoglycan DD-metalloendopeptidase family protein n=1 Tax=Catenovulum agarivorans TaxID=1172192 RepID=UPI0002D97926|nr:peptidoglycan DD-metalloendopeptidase family protein [Catenovulum agarivorans]
MLSTSKLIWIKVLITSLCLSACAQRTGPAPVDSVYRGKSIFDFEPNSLQQSKYTVVKGDTLYSIAFRAGVEFIQLARQNNIKPPYAIFPGQTLVLNKSHNSKGSKKLSPSKQIDISKSEKKVATASKQEYLKSGKQNVNKVKNPIGFDLGSWRWPASGKIVARFSNAELGNKGLEIAGKRGDPIYAANSGKVVYAGKALRGYGNLIIIKHSDDYLSAYAHNQVNRVKEQDWITVGQHIADMGDTDTDEVKLRFEVRFRGSTVDPEKFLPKK